MWTFGRRIAVGFGISFVLLLGIGAVAYRGADALARASYSVAHTHQVIEHVVGMLRPMLWPFTLGSTLGGLLLAGIAYVLVLSALRARRSHIEACS